MLSTFAGLAVVAACVQNTLAWGNLGHETVGYASTVIVGMTLCTDPACCAHRYVAQEFLAPKALSFVQSSLGSTYNKSLGPAATVSRH